MAILIEQDSEKNMQFRKNERYHDGKNRIKLVFSLFYCFVSGYFDTKVSFGAKSGHLYSKRIIMWTWPWSTELHKRN